MGASQAKIGDAKPHFRTDTIEHDVVRLDVAVNDAGGVDGGDPGGHLLEDGQSFRNR